MRFLVDTNILYWLSNRSPELGPKTLRLLMDTTNHIYVSYISLLELTIKSATGKVNYDNKTIIGDIEASGIEIIMPSLSDLEDYDIYDQTNKDPFDNLIITNTIANNLTLITGDRKILKTKAKGLISHNARV